ncbi:TIGR00288 family protein [Methanofervidicoccus sp. A16]|uniref:TIGR00288 family NYN domain-containing protein n=1 Tax=Methanofervidicoccus sp. A16 TaxID=2607662 RepID=UPI001187B2EE|nr:TIGR00288 family NYN domain-containing protein [Methanofervidicoccus sp. A16]AXI24725.1 TIGR00288 family protein [Methanofervidicoccus sp. A16]
MWGKLKKICIKKSSEDEGKDRIALLIDGPNMLRKEFNVDLDKIREVLSKFGKIIIGRVYLNQYASDKLIEAIANQGFEPRVTAGDVDVEMAVEGTELIFNKNVDTIAYMTRDADFLPAMRKAKEHGKKIIVIGAEPGFSLAIQNIADHVIKIEDDFTFDREKLARKKEKKSDSENNNLEEKKEEDREEVKKDEVGNKDSKEGIIEKIFKK